MRVRGPDISGIVFKEYWADLNGVGDSNLLYLSSRSPLMGRRGRIETPIKGRLLGATDYIMMRDIASPKHQGFVPLGRVTWNAFHTLGGGLG